MSIDVLQKVSSRTISTLFQNYVVKQVLIKLKKQYDLVLFDDTIGNVSITCWMFYGLTLIKELGLDKDIKIDTNSTCENYKHIHEDLCKTFHLSINSKNIYGLSLVAKILRKDYQNSIYNNISSCSYETSI